MKNPTLLFQTILTTIVLIVDVLSIDHCPDGWLQHHESCYFFSRTTSQWGSAMSICQSFQSNLVEIETPNEDMFIRNYLLTNHKDDKKGIYFIGGNDIEVENEYIWSSSRQKMTYTRWATGQPDSLAHDGDDCISMDYYSDYQWHDTQCDISYRFICEIKLDGDIGQIIG